MRKIAVCFLVCVAAAVFITGCREKQQSAEAELLGVNWKISHSQAPTHNLQLSAEKMAAYVKEKSGGKFVIDVYHSGTLGTEHEVIENMQEGTIAGNFAAASLLANFVSCYNLFALPAMFSSEEQYTEVMSDNEIMGKMNAACEQAGILNYGYFQHIFRGLYTKKPLREVSDFTGQKIRVMGSPILIATYQALGCNPTTTAWGELFSALQLGVCDGLDHVAGSVKSMSFYQNLSAVTMPKLFTSPMFFVVSKAMYDKLPNQYKKIFDEAVVAVLIPELNEHADKAEEEAFRFLITEGKLQLVETNVAAIHAAVAPVRDKYLGEMEPWIQDIGKAILAKR
jgi:TRAP-type C4-dicarboxylate transport system substrate-binding protein